MKPVVAVTGASGFVGRSLCQDLMAQGYTTVPLVRTPRLDLPGAVPVGEVGADTDWSQALAGVDCVVHCAGRAHVVLGPGASGLDACRRVNVAGTRQLALAAARAGVRRLVFVSSIKVLGERSGKGAPLRFDSPPAPEDAYGISKWEAEQALQEISAQTGLQAVTVRPPLVYGPGAKANFLRLVQAVARGAPLPLGSVRNHRSLVALDNLTDLLVRCTDHPDAPGHTFLVSDDHDLSTPDLIRGLAEALHRPARLLPCPISLLRLGGLMSGRSDQIERLIGNLQVDIGHTKEVLRWTPRCSVQQALRSAVQDFRG
jgi:nucleoside-diphosphate-sugar epimerase